MERSRQYEKQADFVVLAQVADTPVFISVVPFLRSRVGLQSNAFNVVFHGPIYGMIRNKLIDT
jgi:hypothetical protein